MSIEISKKTVLFVIDGTLIHRLAITHDNMPYNYDLPVRIENNNDNSSTSDVEFHVLASSIYRLGKLSTESIYKYVDTDTTSTLKYGAGTLHKVIVTSTSGTLDIYDNTSASSPEIALIDAGKTTGTLDFDVPLSDGLTVVSSGGPTMTVVYE